MARDPYFKFFVSDWLGSNNRAAMTLAQQGAYINLLARQWSDKTCSLPDDDEVLAGLSEMGQGWFNGGSHLVRVCFPPHPDLEGRIANPKLLKLRVERDEFIAKSSLGGRKSAEAKKLRAGKGGSTTLSTKRQPKGKHTIVHSLERKKPPTPFDPTKVIFPPPLNTPRFQKVWADWCRHRREIRKPLKPTQTEKQLKKLAGMGHDRAVRTIEHTIEKGWQGLREPGEQETDSEDGHDLQQFG